jgi:hypothetical protein
MQTPNAFVERRQFGRRNTCLHGWMMLEGRPRIACLVRNVSEGGALLECEVPKVMPYRLGLIIDCKGFEAWCELRHQTERWVGVRFVHFERVQEPIAHWSPEVEDAWAGKKG